MADVSGPHKTPSDGELIPPDALRKALPQDIVSRLKQGDDKRIAQALVTLVKTEYMARHYSGPLPAPEDLKAYADCIQNGAERIMAMAERQAEHRTQLEKLVIHSQQRSGVRGQWMAFILSLVCLLLAAALAYLGHDNVAMVFGGGTVVSLASVFIIGKVLQNQDLRNKRAATPQ